jgi:hypothetical protein
VLQKVQWWRSLPPIWIRKLRHSFTPAALCGCKTTHETVAVASYNVARLVKHLEDRLYPLVVEGYGSLDSHLDGIFLGAVTEWGWVTEVCEISPILWGT